MSWDLKLNERRDLTAGLSTGINEIIQRLITRLYRELGEWFLNVNAGLPWYAKGEGLLGSRDKSNFDLLIRKETLETSGIERIISFETVYNTTQRSYSISMIVLTSYGAISLTLNEGGATWQA